ncbi:hypothetical protein A3F55_02470 [Candidatus Adlerbacteria bacterium RIFCSPHIGHO2_12_FULL_53_18]|uniref:MOSC domain-containing protein n=1 Tax=Candidatus Adlerbacteria bacterium RIFCSPHIGHO2_12_FULL_53_18 TaxID=1797242 RepID=A0A1F4XSQ4_9BACT|nr:MAG: hypothetical protein A3F55_02470 [Candidatus Adlerbacteria bacterium RIFCSPHIGHO2_12_FULL_53_18]
MTSFDVLTVGERVGILGDRRYGIKRKPASTPDEWGPKGKFYVAMNTPVMPAEHPVYNTGLAGPDGMSQLDFDYLTELATRIGVEGPLAVLDTKGKFNLTDDKEPYVSFLNLASVQALDEWLGHEINPARFRMNVWLGDLDPFAELMWVNGYPGTYEFQLGEVRFRVEDVCERCRATEANPETGVYDLPILAALEKMMKERGYAGSPKRKKFEVMGVLARPLNSGKIKKGDSLTFL